MTQPAFAAETKPVAYFDEVEYLFLEDSSFGVFQIVGLYSDDFRPIAEDGIRFWKPGESLWLRIPMAKLREAALWGQESILIVWNEYISRVDFFLPVGRGEFKHSFHGLDTPITLRSFPSRYPTFRLEGTYGEEYAYLNIKANVPIAFGLAVQAEQDFYGLFVGYLTRYMAFYSFMAALILAYFFFYFMTGDLGYLIAVLRQSSTLLFLFAFNGYFQYYFYFTPGVVYIICWFSLGLHCIMTSLFCKYLLQLDMGPAWLRRLIFSHALVGMTIIVTSFWHMPYVSLMLAALAAILEIASIAAMGIVKFRQGYRLIFLFMLSRISLAMGFAFLSINIFFVWRTYIFEHLAMIAFVLDPLFLASMMVPGTRRRFENYFALEKKDDRYEKLNQRDAMTGLYNKAYFLALLEDNVRAAHLSGKPLACVIMDIDHFQKFNDTWGYPEGDKIMLFLAKLIRQSLRESDIAARYGSGEFSIILPGGTLPSTVLVAERIRQTFEDQTVALDKNKGITLSLGLSFLRERDSTVTLIQRADEALYRAKSAGRNRTEFEASP
ncbi:MAG: sensor domain-containing diguanylate cyclase [Synergistaceae bacterium]|jgi:diguanylate cyclase (GGDEF)-like protein|nr:sensor domain-containing diguanylate cyclase [Synergistaceae bacterium]